MLGVNTDSKSIVGNFCGTGMHGGKIYLRCKEQDLPQGLPKQVAARPATEEDMSVIDEYIDDYCNAFKAKKKEILHHDFTFWSPTPKTLTGSYIPIADIQCNLIKATKRAGRTALFYARTMYKIFVSLYTIYHAISAKEGIFLKRASFPAISQFMKRFISAFALRLWAAFLTHILIFYAAASLQTRKPATLCCSASIWRRASQRASWFISRRFSRSCWAC